ncbi:MAG: RcnB family protein [Sphingomicrobium sp.]
MRKFTMALLIAATAVPAMAVAQEEEGGRQGRQHQSAQSDNRHERAERAERPERAERQQMQVERQVQVQQMQGQRQAQIEQMQAARQQQVQQVQQGQAERHDGERNRMFGGRDRRQQDVQQVVQGSREERMQQYRAQVEQRRAQMGGQIQQPSQGGLVERHGRYRSVPDINPNTAGRPAPENRDGALTARHLDRRNQVQWSNHWRNDNRYDWRRFRDHHRSTFRIGFYYDPFGYSYNRFNIGSFLYPSYYRSNYWISDTWRYRLPPAYGPYRWVRYHNDALMIDTWSGEVVDVIYGFFW